MTTIDAAVAPEKVGIEISFGGRSAWVFRRLINGQRTDNYYVAGHPPGGPMFMRSTGFSTKSEALDRAKLLWKARLSQHLDGVREALEGSKLKRTKLVATVGQILAAHEAAQRSGRLHVRPIVAAGYRNCLVRVVAWARGLHMMGEKRVRRTIDRAAVERLSLAVIADRDFVPGFERAYTDAAAGNRVTRERLLRGAAAVLRNARAMFEPVALRAYQELTLPELTCFMKTEMKEPRAVKHAGLEDSAVREMAAAALELREREPDLYLVHLCLRHFGLRNIELMEARQEWIELCDKTVELNGGVCHKLKLADGTEVEARLPNLRKVAGLFAVELRPYFDPKGSEGKVGIALEVLAEMAPWRAGMAPLDFLVPAATVTDRWELIYRRHADFVRPWTAHLAKRGYELRRWGATTVARLHQSEEMADLFLRHAKTTTAQKHYLTERPLPAPITFADVGLQSSTAGE